MPLSADPSDTISYVLATDAGKSPAPTFRLGFLTARQRRLAKADYFSACDELRADKPDEEKIESLLLKVIAVGLAGTENMPQRERTEPDLDLADVLTADELFELAAATLREPVTEEKKRKSRSPSATDTAGSAPAAGAAAATTSQPPTSPSSSSAPPAAAADVTPATTGASS